MLSEPPIYYDPCSVFVGLFELRCLIEFSCSVRFAIYLCTIFPILQNKCCMDLLYFLTGYEYLDFCLY